MKPFWRQKFGNPFSIHSWGQEARRAVETAREQVAEVLGAESEEIIFTSGSTESINLAHKGLLEVLLDENPKRKLHLVTTSLEHKAVLETCKHLEKLGKGQATFLPVDKYGLVKVTDVKKAIRPETVLVSIMCVNNEVGTIQPVEEVGKMLAEVNRSRTASHQPRIFFHTDATQAVQYLDCDVDKLGVDFLSLSGHKFYGPKGVGVLYVRKGTPLTRQQNGGGQEHHLRAGTENVPYIIGLGKAIKLVTRRKKKMANKVAGLRDKLIEGVLKKVPETILTGHPKKRSPHIASFCFKRAEGEAILLALDEKGIGASSGSACTSGTLDPSHVLLAMGIPPEVAHGSIRFSLGRETTEKEIDYVLAVLPGIIERLRAMAPKLS